MPKLLLFWLVLKSASVTRFKGFEAEARISKVHLLSDGKVLISAISSLCDQLLRK